MGYYRDRVKSFKGKVYISDVQNEFDTLVNAINANVDKINTYSNLDVDDFYLGSTQIPSANYTLTLGALKSILTAYDKEVIGGTVVKNPLNTDQAIVFPLLSIDSNRGISQVAQAIINKPTQQEISVKPDIGKGVYINPSTNVVTDDNTLAIGFYRSDIATIDDFSSMTYGTISYSSQYNQITNVSRFYYSENNSYNAFVTGILNRLITPSLIMVRRLGVTPLRNVDINVIYRDSSNVRHDKWIRVRNDNIEAPDNFIVETGDPIINVRCNDTIYLESILVSFYTEFEEQSGLEVDILMDGYLYTYNTGSTPQIDPNLVTVADIDWKRDEYIMNTTEDNIFVNPDKSPAIMVNTQAWANGNWTYAIGLNNNRSQFLLPQVASLDDNQSSVVQIDGKTIQSASAGAQHKWHCQTYVYAPIWIPKGLATTVNSYAVSKALYYTTNQRN